MTAVLLRQTPSALSACLAILQRDLRAVLRSRSQLYSSLVFPLMLLAVLGTGVSHGLDPSSERIRNGDYESFLVPGLIVMTALFSSTFSSASYYQDRDSGILRVMFASPHSPP
ncbi:MAG TPA: ABC transporter permease, partial [Dehalococcoidia bacterium]|nr:ABC transporter permease [Dehalococcoidia bacterium]